jgi:hypothetical protein
MMIDTLTSPIVLFFVLGFAAALARSDLTIPESFAKAMSIYLMAAIGLKGGVEVARTGLTHELVTTALAGFPAQPVGPLSRPFASDDLRPVVEGRRRGGRGPLRIRQHGDLPDGS